MADTKSDLAYDRALSDLQAWQEIAPCSTFEPASGLLSDWCLCGWGVQSHDVLTREGA